ncbi:MAG: hypothetical protein MUF75_08490 [Bacteroidia bacterium]|nr:hypothetical protein [Bacteroidia bacterium]
MKTWMYKIDSWWAGLLIGLIFPVVIFFLYWLFLHSQINFPVRFIIYLKNGYLLSNVIKLCGLSNLVLFYLSLNKKLDKFSKGIIISVLLYVALVAYVTYYHEPELY